MVKKLVVNFLKFLLMLVMFGNLSFVFCGFIFYDRVQDVLVVGGYKDYSSKLPWRFYDLYNFSKINNLSVVELKYNLDSNSYAYFIKSHLQIKGSFNYFEIYINNTNDYDLVDYPIRINLSSIGINFTYFFIFNPSTLKYLPYCFEQLDGNCNETPSEIIWVKIDKLTANSITKIWIVEHDRNVAEKGVCELVSDGYCWIFYDDFDDKNESKWIYTLGHQYGFENSAIWFRYNADYNLATRTVRKFVSPVVIEAELWKNDNESDHFIYISPYQNVTFKWISESNVIKFVWNHDYKTIYGQINENSSYRPDETNYTIRITILPNKVIFEDWKSSNSSDYDRLELEDSLNNFYVYFGADQDNPSHKSYWFWIRVRKYSDTEPTIQNVYYKSEVIDYSYPNFVENNPKTSVYINKTFISMPDSYIKFGELDGNNFGVNGPTIVSTKWYNIPWKSPNPSDWTCFQIRGKARIYGTTIRVVDGGFSVTDDADVEIIDSVILGYVRFASSNLKLVRVKMRNVVKSDFPEFVKKPVLLEDIEVDNFNYYLSFYQKTGSITVYGLTIRNCRNGISLPERGGQTQTILNMKPFYDPEHLEYLRGWNMNNSIVYYNFTLNIKVFDEAGNKVGGAIVKIYNKYGDLVFEGQTDENGTLNLSLTSYKAIVSDISLNDADKSYVPSGTSYYWNVYNYNPFKIVISKEGYLDFESYFEIKAPLNIYTTLFFENAISELEVKLTALSYERGENATIVAVTTYNGRLYDVDYVSFKLLDKEGNLVIDWKNMSRISPGVYTYTFNTSSMDPGIYIVKFKAVKGFNVSESYDVIKIEENTLKILSKMEKVEEKVEEINKKLERLYVDIDSYTYIYPNQTLQVISKFYYNNSLVNPTLAYLEIYYPNNTLLANISSYYQLKEGILIFNYTFDKDIEAGFYKLLLYGFYGNATGSAIKIVKIGRGIYDLIVKTFKKFYYPNQTLFLNLTIISKSDVGQDVILEYKILNTSLSFSETIYTPPLEKISFIRSIKLLNLSPGNYTIKVTLRTVDNTYIIYSYDFFFVIFPKCYLNIIKQTYSNIKNFIFINENSIILNFVDTNLKNLYVNLYEKYPDEFENYIECLSFQENISTFKIKGEIFLNESNLKINSSIIYCISDICFNGNGNITIINSKLIGNNTLFENLHKINLSYTDIIGFEKYLHNTIDFEYSQLVYNIPFDENKIYFRLGTNSIIYYRVKIKYVSYRFEPIPNASVIVENSIGERYFNGTTNKDGIIEFYVKSYEFKNDELINYNPMYIYIQNPYADTFSSYIWNVSGELDVIIDPYIKLGLAKVSVKKRIESEYPGKFRYILDLNVDYGFFIKKLYIYLPINGNFTLLSYNSTDTSKIREILVENNTIVIITENLKEGDKLSIFLDISMNNSDIKYLIGVDPIISYFDKMSEDLLIIPTNKAYIEVKTRKTFNIKGMFFVALLIIIIIMLLFVYYKNRVEEYELDYFYKELEELLNYKK